MLGFVKEACVVALDPGRNIGVAFVSKDGVLGFHAVLDLAQLEGLEFPPATVLVGNGTGSDTVKNLLTKRGIHFEVVDEWGSSLTARKLYFRDQPPTGFTASCAARHENAFRTH